ncbi:MAG: CoA transferase [Chloroflexi bacterium]|nr:CoA transferase [Chloroflexota bacterium]
MAGPLDGIRYLDLAPLGPGGHCSRMLADLGCDVIRITDPAPDVARGASPLAALGSKGYSLRRNTRVIGIDLREEQGREVFYKLAGMADAMGVGFRPRVPARLGIDYETIAKINPRIIYCSLTGYGATGPYANYASHDINYQSIGGLVALTGPRGGRPYVSGTIADSAGGGWQGVIGILAAIIARESTGKGQFVDVSATDGILSIVHRWVESYLDTGEAVTRGTDLTTGKYPWFDIYQTRDGKYLSVGAVEPYFYANLCRLLGREDLIPHQHADDKKLDEIRESFIEIFRTRNRDEWLAVLMAGDACAAPVYEMDEIAGDPQLAQREMIVDVAHPDGGTVRQVAPLIKFSETPSEIKNVEPQPGAFTDEILGPLGYTRDRIRELTELGVVE